MRSARISTVAHAPDGPDGEQVLAVRDGAPPMPGLELHVVQGEGWTRALRARLAEELGAYADDGDVAHLAEIAELAEALARLGGHSLPASRARMAAEQGGYLAGVCAREASGVHVDLGAAATPERPELALD